MCVDLPEGWIAHLGGPCPVPLNSRPGVMFRDGMKIDNPEETPTAGEWIFEGGKSLWDHLPGRADIIAYCPETVA